MQRFNPGWACGFSTIGISIISNSFDSLFYQYNENQTEQLPDANVWFGVWVSKSYSCGISNCLLTYCSFPYHRVGRETRDLQNEKLQDNIS